MPDFVFRGAIPGMYPMLRDSYDVPAGTVKPGDVMALDEAPDADWVPYEDERAGIESDPDPADVPGGPGDSGSEQDHDTAGETGSEEN